jgi:hypothetical protein
MTTAQKTKSAAGWWLTLSNTGNSCERCRATIPAEGEFVYRNEPRGILCRRCADDDPAISYATSGRWRRAQTSPTPDPLGAASLVDSGRTVAEAFRSGYAEGRRDAHAELAALRAQLERARMENRFSTLPADLLDRVVRLTHPDRHPAERAGEANAVTAALLDLRSDRGPR